MKTFIHIGTANFGLHWLKNVIPKHTEVARCVAAVDIVPEHLKNAETFLGLPPEKCYTDLDKALSENPVDFVTIASSIPSHEEVVNTVLKYGCHILSEKPLAHSMEACGRMYANVKKAGIKFAVTMSHRYEDDKQTLGALLKSGQYGKVNYIVSRIHIARPKWPSTHHRERELKYMLIDGGVHNIDMIRAFTGANAERMYANIWKFNPGEKKDPARAAFVCADMENGAKAFLEYSFGGAYGMNGWGHEYFRVECADAMIEVDNRKLTVRSHAGYPVPEYADIPLLEGDHWDHHLLVRQFISWLDGGEAPTVTIDDSIYAMAMMFAAVESAETGVPVMVKEFMKRYV